VLDYPARRAEVLVDLQAAEEEYALAVGERGWRMAAGKARTDQGVALDAAGAQAPLARMLSHFREAALGREAPRVDLSHVLVLRRTVALSLAALAQAGAPFERAQAPRHVASRSLSPGATRY
jgi:hypothetical protein